MLLMVISTCAWSRIFESSWFGLIRIQHHGCIQVKWKAESSSCVSWCLVLQNFMARPFPFRIYSEYSESYSETYSGNFKNVRKTQDILRFIDFGKKWLLQNPLLIFKVDMHPFMDTPLTHNLLSFSLSFLLRPKDHWPEHDQYVVEVIQ